MFGQIMCLENFCSEPIQKFVSDKHMLEVMQRCGECKDAVDRYFYQVQT